MTKMFVLRPNALLSSENSTQMFGNDNVVVIPRAVLDEVQSRKNLSSEKAKFVEGLWSIFALITTMNLRLME